DGIRDRTVTGVQTCALPIWDAAQHLPAPRSTRDGRDGALRGETGNQTDQEARSAGHRARPSVTAMHLTIHSTFLPHADPDASLRSEERRVGKESRAWLWLAS